MSVTADNLTDDAIEEYGDAMMAAGNLGQWNLARSGLSSSPLAKRVELFRAIRVKLAAAINATRVLATTVTGRSLVVADGATGIRTSQLDAPVKLDRITVSGAGSVGIDMDDSDKKVR